MEKGNANRSLNYWQICLMVYLDDEKLNLWKQNHTQLRELNEEINLINEKPLVHPVISEDRDDEM